jgi:hypothetical protein
MQEPFLQPQAMKHKTLRFVVLIIRDILQIYDANGVLRNFTMPSFTSLKGEIDRLNNNINSLYGIDGAGSLIQTTTQNKYKKLVTVDLNRDPTPISSIGFISTFKSSPNWFFDSLMDPMISIELDLSNKIEDNVRKCLVRRYIVDFEKNADGSLTTNGQSALNSYNQLFRGNANIIISEFENWHKTTTGVLNAINPKFDEQLFDLEPNSSGRSFSRRYIEFFSDLVPWMTSR